LQDITVVAGDKASFFGRFVEIWQGIGADCAELPNGSPSEFANSCCNRHAGQ
jgi:hypothetical protein